MTDVYTPGFADFVHERNKLMKEAFPALQRYCQSLGLELQIVDMRWGVRDESISFHQTSEVCLQEVELCKQLSVGPSFVVSTCMLSRFILFIRTTRCNHIVLHCTGVSR